MSYKKIIYCQPPMETFDKICDNCGEEAILDGDECYYHGDGIYTCSVRCAKEWEGER